MDLAGQASCAQRERGQDQKRLRPTHFRATLLRMIVAAPLTSTGLDAEQLAKAQKDYEAALPRITAHAKVNFGWIKDPGRRDDCIASVVGIGWKHWLSAVRHGKDPNEFVSSIAEMSVRQVRSGRRLDRQERPKDVLSPRARRTEGFTVASLPDHTGTGADGNEAIDALRDNTVTPVPEQAAFRIDYPEFLKSLGQRNGAIASDMATGEATADLADKYDISPARVSQLRREFKDEWDEFHEGRGR
jgi:hypothetical protein